MKIRKTLCSLDKDEIEDNIDEIAKIVSGARYICRKCARVARKKKYLGELRGRELRGRSFE